MTPPKLSDIRASRPLAGHRLPPVTAGGKAPSPEFGNALAIDGNRLLVGARAQVGGRVSPPGAAHLYERVPDGWRKLSDLFGVPDDARDEPYSVQYFGTSVALDGDRAVVGAPRYWSDKTDDSTTWVGAAFVFDRVGDLWRRRELKRPRSTRPLAGFGQAVAIDGDTIVVGAPHPGSVPAPTQQDPPIPGAAYVFDGGFGRTSRRRLRPKNEPPHGSHFGAAVAVHDGMIAVGAPAQGGMPGAVHVFVRAGRGWKRSVVLSAGIGDDHFGASLALTADLLVIGAPTTRPDGGAAPGAVYAVPRKGSRLGELVRLIPSGAVHGDQVGRSVAADTNHVLAGAPGSTREAQGRAFLWLREPDATFREIDHDLGVGLRRKYDQFGTAVALGPDVAVIGCVGEQRVGHPKSGDGNAPDGAVYTFGGRSVEFDVDIYARAPRDGFVAGVVAAELPGRRSASGFASPGLAAITSSPPGVLARGRAACQITVDSAGAAKGEGPYLGGASFLMRVLGGEYFRVTIGEAGRGGPYHFEAYF